MLLRDKSGKEHPSTAVTEDNVATVNDLQRVSWTWIKYNEIKLKYEANS